MADLIDRDALLADISTTVVFSGRTSRNAEICGANKIINRIRSAPTVDAVEVVRCRECKYHYWEQEPCHGKSVHYCKLPHMRGVEVFKEFFCYYGERKDGDGND